MKEKLTIEGLHRKVARLTQNNDCNESVLVLAKYLSNQEAIDKMESIIKKQERLGHMPYELIGERMGIHKGLMDEVEAIHGRAIRISLNTKF